MNLQYFKQFQDYFNNQLPQLLKNYVHSEKIIERINYSLKGGKRLRPVITLDLCQTLCQDKEKGLLMAFAIELIHTASIILDDMPCMDNDYYRRGQKSFHIKYNISEAQIISTLLMELSHKIFYQHFSNNSIILATMFDIISKNLGINGIAHGQYLDLAKLDITDNKQSAKNKLDKPALKQLLNQKTTTLFEIAFVGGYLSGSKNIKNITKIQKASEHFGLAFQIYDDFDDIEQDKKRLDINITDPNYVNNLGVKEAYNDFHNHIIQFRELMIQLNLYSDILIELTNYLSNKVNQKIKNISNN
jgi:geranylgeranyl diphosphate synthase, type II